MLRDASQKHRRARPHFERIAAKARLGDVLSRYGVIPIALLRIAGLAYGADHSRILAVLVLRNTQESPIYSGVSI